MQLRAYFFFQYHRFLDVFLLPSPPSMLIRILLMPSGLGLVDTLPLFPTHYMILLFWMCQNDQGLLDALLLFPFPAKLLLWLLAERSDFARCTASLSFLLLCLLLHSHLRTQEKTQMPDRSMFASCSSLVPSSHALSSPRTDVRRIRVC